MIGMLLLVVCPANGQFETVINVPPDVVPSALESDTQLNLFFGGGLPELFRAGPVDNTGANIEVNVLGGEIGDKFNAYNGSTINLETGRIGNDFHALSGSVVSIQGGVVGEHFDVAGGNVTISDGVVGDFARVFQGGRLTIDGGELGDGVDVFNGSELNVAGGSVGFRLTAQAFSTVHLSGGYIAANFDARNGSNVRISGGTVGPRFFARGGSQVEISGGFIEGRFRAVPDSSVRILGGEFYLDNTLIAGLENLGDSAMVDLPTDSILSGILADGTHFAFSTHNNDSISDGVLTLEVAEELPPIDLSTIVASTDPVPIGIRRGQTLLVDDGAMVRDGIQAGPGAVVRVESGGQMGGDLRAVGADVMVLGGQIGPFFKALGSTVNITGGEIDNAFRSENSEVSIHGGHVGNSFAAIESTVRISAGSIGAFFNASAGSSVTISGGQIGPWFGALDGSRVIFRGGGIDRGFRALDGSQVTIVGGEFRLDGVPVDLVTPGDRTLVDVPIGVSMSGVLADGTPFVFTYEDSLSEGEITLEAVELPPVMTTLITASIDDVPLGLRQGQTLRVDDGSIIRDGFTASWRSTVHVEPGGSVGRRFEAFGAEVNVGGMIGQSFRALDSTVRVEAGEIGSDFEATNSAITISGGEIGDGFEAKEGTVTITGGTVGQSFHASSSTVDLSAGTIGHSSRADRGSVVTISGGNVESQFSVNNSTVSIHGGTVGRSFLAVNDSQVTLTGGFIDAGFQMWGNSTLDIAGRHFWVNGKAVEGLDEPGSRVTLNLNSESTVTGTLADGTPFAFAGGRSGLIDVDLTLESRDLPPVESPTIQASVDPIPLSIREGQTLIVDDGGVVTNRFRAGTGSSVIVESGGILAGGMDAIGATVVVAADGSIGEDNGQAFNAFAASDVTISGGRIGPYFYVENSDVTMSSGSIGWDFEATGQSHVHLLNGTISDSARFGDGSSLTMSGGGISQYLWADGANVEISSGWVGDFFRITDGSEVSISGGSVGNGFRATDSVVRLSGGRIGHRFRADSGSRVMITGGQFGQDFTAHEGSTVTVSGGIIGFGFVAEEGSNIFVTGGSLGDYARMEDGSHMEISGGTIGEAFQAERFSNLLIQGGEFRLDGAVIEGLENVGDQVEFVLGAGVLSGTLADGTPFAFTRADGDTLSRSLVLEASALAPIGPVSLVASRDAIPLGVRNGQTLRADKGSVIPDHFNAGLGSTVLVEPGAVVGRNLEAVGAHIDVSGGSVGAGLDAFGESVVTVSGGIVGDTFSAYAGSEVHILGTEFWLDDLEIAGLAEPGDSIVLSQRDADLTGRLLDGNLFHFELNATLALPRDYFDPDATVRLTLGDSVPRDCDFDTDGACGLPDIDALVQALGGNAERFDLNGSGTVDRADVEAWLSSAGQKSLGRPYVFGDATLDGAVDQADLNVLGLYWQSAVTGWSRGDFNGDGQIDALDLNEVGDNWMSRAVPAQAVPEPAGMGLAWLVLSVFMIRRESP